MQNDSTAFVVGIGGPVGSGKTILLKSLCTEMREHYSIGVVVNDLYGPHDAQYLEEIHLLETTRILSVVTGNVKKQISRQNEKLNQQAIRRLSHRFNDLDIIFIEGIGDRMDSEFSHRIVDCFIYVIDAADGERLPLKGGAGICSSEILVINKIDLLNIASGSLGRLTLNVQKMRGMRMYVLAALERGLGVDHIVNVLQKMIGKSKGHLIDSALVK